MAATAATAAQEKQTDGPAAVAGGQGDNSFMAGERGGSGYDVEMNGRKQ